MRIQPWWLWPVMAENLRLCRQLYYYKGTGAIVPQEQAMPHLQLSLSQLSEYARKTSLNVES